MTHYTYITSLSVIFQVVTNQMPNKRRPQTKHLVEVLPFRLKNGVKHSGGSAEHPYGSSTRAGSTGCVPSKYYLMEAKIDALLLEGA